MGLVQSRGFGVTQGGTAIAEHAPGDGGAFISEAVRHGLDTRSAGGGTDSPGSNTTTNSSSGSGSQWVWDPTQGIWIPSQTNPQTGIGPNPSFIINQDGSVTFNGNSGLPSMDVIAPNLSQAEQLWQQKFGAIFGMTGTTGNSPGTGSTPTDPFTQLATLLGSLSGNAPAVPVPSSNDTGSQVVPTTGGPSMLIPLVLVALAGFAVWWWYKHRHHGGGEE